MPNSYSIDKLCRLRKAVGDTRLLLEATATSMVFSLRSSSHLDRVFGSQGERRSRRCWVARRQSRVYRVRCLQPATSGGPDDLDSCSESDTFCIQTVNIVNNMLYDDIASTHVATNNRGRFLKPIPPDTSSLPTVSTSGTSAGSFAVAPTLCVLNPTSLAKSHALQDLRADLESNSIDVSIIRETWFKASHEDLTVNRPGYNLFRRHHRNAGVWESRFT